MTQKDQSDIYSISPDQPFNFRCGPSVNCFNACCADLNQYLSPYDVLQLKRGLNMRASDFLETWTNRHDGPRSGLPVVSLKPQTDAGLKCPFVTPRGCGVYEYRPASCRMYPVMRMAGRDTVSGCIRESYYIICESHCHGFETGHRITLDQWMHEQGLHPYNIANDAFLDIISAKRKYRPGGLEQRLTDEIYIALYDSDTFMENRRGYTAPQRSCAPEDDGHTTADQAYLAAANEYVISRLRGDRGRSADLSKNKAF